MKGSRSILALLAVILVLAAVAVSAQDSYMMTVDKSSPATSVVPPTSSVKYERILYTFMTPVALNVRFETVDANRVKLTVQPATAIPYSCNVSVQWLAFPPVMLDIEGGGSGSFMLNTETGYAEK
jgi:hypothetical protein